MEKKLKSGPSEAAFWAFRERFAQSKPVIWGKKITGYDRTTQIPSPLPTGSAPAKRPSLGHTTEHIFPSSAVLEGKRKGNGIGALPFGLSFQFLSLFVCFSLPYPLLCFDTRNPTPFPWAWHSCNISCPTFGCIRRLLLFAVCSGCDHCLHLKATLVRFTTRVRKLERAARTRQGSPLTERLGVMTRKTKLDAKATVNGMSETNNNETESIHPSPQTDGTSLCEADLQRGRDTPTEQPRPTPAKRAERRGPPGLCEEPVLKQRLEDAERELKEVNVQLDKTSSEKAKVGGTCFKFQLYAQQVQVLCSNLFTFTAYSTTVELYKK